jgi:hypothetical protein
MLSKLPRIYEVDTRPADFEGLRPGATSDRLHLIGPIASAPSVAKTGLMLGPGLLNGLPAGV